MSTLCGAFQCVLMPAVLHLSAVQCKSWMHSHARPCVLPGIAGKASPQQIQKAHASDKPLCFTHLVTSDFFGPFFFPKGPSTTKGLEW